MSDANTATRQPRVALVTGAARGIGYAIAERFWRDGMEVVFIDIVQEEAEAASRTVSGDGSRTHAFAADVSDEASVKALYTKVDAEIGRVEVLANNAGISPRVNGANAYVEDTPLDVWQKTLAVNLTGTFLMCREAVPRMRKAGWGRIINMASIAARSRGEVASGYYAASKGGVVAFSRILAAEAGPSGITVNCISPARIVSPLTRTYSNTAELDQRYIDKTPVRRIGYPEDVAEAAAYLASEATGYVSGTIMDVTGGYYMP
ncbi:SDR family NAD(P)-dependent oxidoreductase [Corticibacterium sp. UT-5YL-CI-8]|nr:SDR family NAD(P)-dependent oxidoreductase [Tianweitania sp. UT-5YL-CI-8]